MMFCFSFGVFLRFLSAVVKKILRCKSLKNSNLWKALKISKDFSCVVFIHLQYYIKQKEMPSKRKEGKKQVAVWLTPAEKKALVELSSAAEKNMSDFLKEQIYEHIKKQKNEK